MTSNYDKCENDMFQPCNEECMIDFSKPYGHAMCPSCYGDVNLKEELYGFVAQSSKDSHEFLYYFLCPVCGNKLSDLNPHEVESFKQEIISNNKDKLINDSKIDDLLGNIKRWTAIASFTELFFNDFVPADAFEYGPPTFDKNSQFIKINPCNLAKSTIILLPQEINKYIKSEDDNNDN